MSHFLITYLSAFLFIGLIDQMIHPIIIPWYNLGYRSITLEGDLSEKNQ